MAHTAGRRLDAHARRLIAARLPDFAWREPLKTLIDHLATLPEPIAGRFDRIESATGPIDFFARIPDADDAPGADESGASLPSDVQARLRRVTGHDASAVREHHDATSDALARAHGAEAVTYGRDVYFREGRFRPHEPSGFGLLAHEATHVAQVFAPGATWSRLTRAGRDEEEDRAAVNERAAASDMRGPGPAPMTPHRDVFQSTLATPGSGPPTHSTVPPPNATPAPTGSLASHPMPAALDRDSPAPPAIDVEALRRSLIQDLKRQLRSEFERGG